jgi:3-oxoacyl-[acyl-carrier-protein] synthase II
VAAGQAAVVVTGLGATTPLGGDVPGTWRALLAGDSGISALTDPWARDLPVRIAAAAAADPAPALGRVLARRLDRCEQFALVAARQAWTDAGAPGADPDRMGVAVAAGTGGVTSLLAAYDTLATRGWQRLSPYAVPMLMPNGPAGWISIELGARAGVHTTVSAGASGAESIAYAIDMIRCGRADVVIAGGTEAAISPLTIAAFAVMRALSVRNDEPARASRPFDQDRDGFVLGEGAAILVLESAAHAARRGARVHAITAGSGYAADACHITQPAPGSQGAARAMTRALADAGLPARQVIHVNAHASATPAGDRAEARAIAATPGTAPGRAVVPATKSMTGHLLGAAGALESIFAILALRNRMAPPAINLDHPGHTAGLDIATSPRPLPHPGTGPAVALTNSSGFGGHHIALAFTTP